MIINNMDLKNFADRLNFAIKETGVSAYKISKKIEMQQSTISDYRKGKREPNISVIKNIASILKVNSNWLLTGKGSMLREQPQKDPINLVSEPQASYSTNTSQSLERELDLLKTQLKDKERIISMLEKEVIRLENELKKFTS